MNFKLAGEDAEEQITSATASGQDPPLKGYFSDQFIALPFLGPWKSPFLSLKTVERRSNHTIVSHLQPDSKLIYCTRLQFGMRYCTRNANGVEMSGRRG
ncbi:YALI0D01958p [Anopheles sinensis]|uniref:YALI0D01958p n=1 Tax=Anopheles sinensis TaxID=74873 RepID=A0A084WS80_ANOSI|nr:YALI0D01958p [Anopheles sinensis]